MIIAPCIITHLLCYHCIVSTVDGQFCNTCIDTFVQVMLLLLNSSISIVRVLFLKMHRKKIDTSIYLQFEIKDIIHEL